MWSVALFKKDKAIPLAVPRGAPNKTLHESNHTWSFASQSRNFHLQGDLQTAAASLMWKDNWDNVCKKQIPKKGLLNVKNRRLQ